MVLLINDFTVCPTFYVGLIPSNFFQIFSWVLIVSNTQPYLVNLNSVLNIVWFIMKSSLFRTQLKSKLFTLTANTSIYLYPKLVKKTHFYYFFSNRIISYMLKFPPNEIGRTTVMKKGVMRGDERCVFRFLVMRVAKLWQSCGHIFSPLSVDSAYGLFVQFPCSHHQNDN